MSRRIAPSPHWARYLNPLHFWCSALPRHDPLITGLADYYDDGDLVSANCTTDRSSPAASIAWFINGERVDTVYPNQYHEETVDAGEFHLKMRTLELSFTLDRHRHLLNGQKRFELRCSAVVDGLSTSTILEKNTIRHVSLREDDISNQKQMTYLADTGCGLRRRPLIIWLLPLLLCVLVSNRSTQLS